jgi:para-aminobenzoate synthetase component 1
MARSLPRIFGLNRPISSPRAKLGAVAMPLRAIVVDIAPDPVAIAQRLEGRSGFAFLHGASDGETGRRSFLAVDPVERSTGWLPPDDAIAGTKRSASADPIAPDTRRDVPRWIGAIPYECARGLERAGWTRTPDDRQVPHLVEPCWHRYGAVIEVDVPRGVVRVVGDDAPSVARLARELGERPPVRRDRALVCLEPLEQDDPPTAHLERIHQVQELIRAGDLYQVNLARRQRFAAGGQPLDLYLAMVERAPAAFGACFDCGGTVVCATSPELFLAIDPVSGRVQTAPIKGTRPRGPDADTDADLCRSLDQSAKEQAELTMILDVERNDLGRVCAAGSVRLLAAPRVETHRTIHHRGAVLGGVLRAGATPLQALRAMFPSGSVTGAPKVRAMEVIARLEPARRGLYTGAFGYVAYGGALQLAMAIRVLTLKKGEAHYFAGGGIVADSDPEAELEETRWKGTQVERLVVGQPSGSRAVTVPRGGG